MAAAMAVLCRSRQRFTMRALATSMIVAFVLSSAVCAQPSSSLPSPSTVSAPSSTPTVATPSSIASTAPSSPSSSVPGPSSALPSTSVFSCSPPAEPDIRAAYECAADVSPNLKMLWSPPRAADEAIKFGALFQADGWVAIGFGEKMVNGSALIVLPNNAARVVLMKSKNPATFEDSYSIIPLTIPRYPAFVSNNLTLNNLPYVFVSFHAMIENNIYPLDRFADPISMIYAYSDLPELGYHKEKRGVFKLDVFDAEGVDAASSMALLSMDEALSESMPAPSGTTMESKAPPSMASGTPPTMESKAQPSMTSESTPMASEPVGNASRAATASKETAKPSASSVSTSKPSRRRAR